MRPLTIEDRNAARQELARRYLLDFAGAIVPDYQPAPHHALICDRLQAVERGDIDRLMIAMPPRHGKSQLASRLFPAWFLGRNPRKQIIAASYNSDVSSDFGRDVRNMVGSEEFGEIFPKVSLAVDSKAANRMNTNQGGTYIAAGVGTAITGRGAHVALIDDPFKDRAEADSERQRDSVWAWYQSTLYTRLMPGGAIVVINTRWHDDDLSGRLLNGNDKWELLELPAINAAGEALWPEWYDIPALHRIKDNIGPREWSALFQQQPQPDEGSYFQRDWLQSWDVRPSALNIYITSDYAVTEDGGDWTVFTVWGVDPKGDLYRLHVWKGQNTPDVWIDQQCDMILRWKPLCWFGESGVIQKAIEPMLRRRMIERKAHCRLEWVSSISDKPTRARSFQSRAAMGRVWFEPAADLSEFLKFPAGKHDDEVDCASMMGRVIDEAHPAIVPAKAVVNEPHDRWHKPKRSNLTGSVWG